MSHTVSRITGDQDEGITLRELFRILSRYKLLIGIIAGSVLLLAGLYVFTVEPQYEASGHIMVVPVRPSLLTDPISGQYSQYSDYSVRVPLNNAVTRLQGTGLADSVIVRTGIYATLDIPDGYFRKVQSFSPVPPEKSRVFTIVPQKAPGGNADYLVMDELGLLTGKGKYGERFSCPDFSIILSPLGPVKNIQIRLDPVATVRRQVLAALKVLNLRDSDIIRIAYRSGDPAKAKLIVNSFITEMEYQDLLEKRQKATALRSFLENQLQGVSSLLENAEDRYLDTKTSSGIVSVSEQTRQYIDLLRFLEERRIDYELRLTEASSAREKAASILAGNPELKRLSKFNSSPFFRDNTLLQELYSRVATLQVDNARLKSMYNSTHPLVLQSNAELEAARKELESAISTTVTDATKGVDPLLRPVLENQLTNDINTNVYQQILSQVKKEIRDLNRTIETLPKSEVEKARYERNVGINQQIHDLLLTRLQEARIMEASTISDIRIINRAELPASPIAPRKARIMLLAMIFGLFAAGAVVFGAEHFKPSFDTVENIEKALGIPVLGLVPRFSRSGSGVRRIFVDPSEEASIRSHAYEVFNSLIINYLAGAGTDRKTVIVTSALAQEGKSVIAANLAVAMAKAGKKVLLVDCDLRRPVLHHIFGAPNEYGLTSLVRGGVTKGFLKTGYPNLVFLPSGDVSEIVPPELLHDSSLAESVRQLENRFDLVIVDTPPVLLYTDAAVLTSHFGNALLVMRPGSDEQAVISAKKALEKAGGTLLGVVVNNIRKSVLFGDIYDHNGYGYGYGYPEKRGEEVGVG